MSFLANTPTLALKTSTSMVWRSVLIAVVLLLIASLAKAEECVRPQGVLYFDDVLTHEWFCQPVYDLVQTGLISQQLDFRFRPSDAVTREEFLKLLVLAKTNRSEPFDPNSDPYSDVPASRWSARYISFAKEQGWIDATANNFNPEAPISRSEAAVILSRMYCPTEESTCSCPNPDIPECSQEPFADADQIPAWAEEHVARVRYLKLMKGSTRDGLKWFDPLSNITRSAAAMIVASMVSEKPSPSSFPDDFENPREINLGSQVTIVRSGESYFKFNVEKGWHYSLIVTSDSMVPHINDDDTLHLHRLYNSDYMPIAESHSRGTFEKRENTGHNNIMPYNISPARSAYVFYADSDRTEHVTILFSQLSVNSEKFFRVKLQLMKFQTRNYHFPFSMSEDIPPEQRAYPNFYHSFHHIDPSRSTNKGHDGVDIAPYSLSGSSNGEASVRPIAEGYIVKIERGNLYPGGAVWVYHPTLDVTSVYVHLKNIPSLLAAPSPSCGAGGSPVSTQSTHLGSHQKHRDGSYHLHLEVRPGKNCSSASLGYGTSNFKDPQTVLFEQ